MAFEENKQLFPELDNLSSSIDQLHTYYGYGESFVPPGGLGTIVTKDYVVCSCFGENPATTLEELEKLTDKKIVFISPRRLSEFQNTKSKIIYFPLGYNLYPTTKDMPKEKLVLDRTFDKTFLSLNRRAQWPRQALYEFIDKFDLYDKCYFSYHMEDRFSEGSKNIWERTQSNIGNTWFNEGVDLNSLFDRLPITVDNVQQTDWSSGGLDFYNTSFCSVVTETFIDENQDPMFTEKIFKPLAYGHPMLVHSSQGALLRLRELGFETFSTVFDESYDLIENPQLRFEAILEQILELSKKSEHELGLMFEKIKPVLEHNYDRFWNGLPKDYNNNLSSLKEEILNYFGVDS